MAVKGLIILAQVSKIPAQNVGFRTNSTKSPGFKRKGWDLVLVRIGLAKLLRIVIAKAE